MRLRNDIIRSKIAASALLLSALHAGAEDMTPPETAASLTPPASSQVSADWSVDLNPLVPVAAIAGLGGLYAAFCLLAAQRRMKGAWLRTGAGAALTITLLNPEIVREQRAALPTEVAIIIDDSASQNFGDRAAITAAVYDDLVKTLEGHGGVTVRTIRLDKEQDKTQTNLFDAARAGLADTPRDRLGAVIMLTDGQIHDAPNDAQSLSFTAPLHALISGAQDEFDRRVVINSAPPFSIVNQPQTINFSILDAGQAPKNAPPAEVTIRLDGVDIEKRIVKPGEQNSVTLTNLHSGSNVLEIRADSLPGELTDINNRIFTSIEGVRENMSVLMISGAPSPNVRAWRNLLKSDPDVDLVHFTFLGAPGKSNKAKLEEMATISVPTTEIFSEKIEQFDLIIFDHKPDDGAIAPAYLANVAKRVRAGGALMIVSGAEMGSNQSMDKSGMADVMPATSTGPALDKFFTPTISADGQRHPVTRGLDATGWGRWTRIAQVSAPSAGYNLMNGADEKPLLILSRMGEGRVAMLQSDTAWLWAKGFEGGGPYAELMQGIARWLMRDPALEEEALRLRNENGRLVIEAQSMETQPDPVTLRAPSGTESIVSLQEAGPGLWRAEIDKTESGLYSAERTGKHPAAAFVNMGPTSTREYADALSTTALIKDLTAATGGHNGRMAAPNGDARPPRIIFQEAGSNPKTSGGGDWLGVRMTEASVLQGIDRTRLPPWAGFTIMIGLLAAAFFREGDRFGKKAPGARPS